MNNYSREYRENPFRNERVFWYITSFDILILITYNVSVMDIRIDYPSLYQQVHWWARKNIPKPDKCSCGSLKKLELSNKDHLYSLNKEDWEWICRSCHAKKDQWNKKVNYPKERMEKLWKARRGKASWNKGLKTPKSVCKKLSISHLGQKAWNKGIPMSEEAKHKLSESLKGKPAWNKGLKTSKI